MRMKMRSMAGNYDGHWRLAFAVGVELKTRNYVLYIPVCYVDKINFIKA
jgi:hypothetical protein